MKKILLLLIIIVTSIIFIARLFYLQIIASNRISNIEEDVAIEAVYDYPQRGYVYDRNGKLLVSNQPAYDVMIVPKEVSMTDTLNFCRLLNIDKNEFIKKYTKAKKYSPFKPSTFINQLSKKEYAYLQEELRKYKGFYIQKRSLRKYNTQSAANVLGYISEVNDWELEKYTYYKSGEVIGRTGIEKQYEEYLRGEKGVRYFQKDKYNRVIGSYKNGIYDTLPVPGKSLKLTIDEELQAYGELLMSHKRGGIVAIEPKTGEILALVSAPTYDPSLLVGRERSKNYTKLYNDSLAKPLYDRALLAEYPPGSPFKVINALIGLQEGVITPETQVICHGGYQYGSRVMKCHNHSGPYHLLNGIAHSCNAYFAHTYRLIVSKYSSPNLGMDAWNRHVKSFGLGDYLGSDFPTGRSGKVPSTEYYDKVYGKNRWSATYNISNGIGQGEILVTPIQLANVMAAIANRGYYFTPHVVKEIDGKTTPIKKFLEPHKTTIDKKYFDVIVKGMNLAYREGTARWTQIEGIEVAAKTGTAENYVKINGKRMQLTDHSIFVAFAPLDDPKIAIAVFVENGYFGARIAGPITSLMIEKYLNRKIERQNLEERMINKSLEEEYMKPYEDKPFTINR